MRLLFAISICVAFCSCGDTTAPPQATVPDLPEPGVPILEYYVTQRAQKDAVVARVEQASGKPFIEWTDGDYAEWMAGLDLNRDDDLWQWSHATGITIVGLTRESTFFFCNAHLLEDLEAAGGMPYEELVSLERGYDPESDMPTLHTADGRPLRIRDVPAGTIRLAARTGRYSHDENYAEPRIVLEALAPYLIELSEIPNRQYITAGLKALPLSMAKAYRGKAIYLTTLPGRSYTVGMPVSNSVYEGFAGMKAGLFLDPNSGPTVTHNLVHEIGHVLDYTGIEGRYGSYLHPYQISSFRELKEARDRVFGKGDASVPQTDHGYLTRYAKANAQESFAEHFAGYILSKERFHELAETERAAGHPELMEKYRFIETLVDRTPPTMVRLSAQYVETLEESGQPSQP